MREPAVAGAALAALMAAVAAPAATSSASFTVQSTVVAGCAVSAQPLAFGSYVPAAGALNATTTIRVGCASGLVYLVLLNAGTTPGGTIGQRLLSSGAGTLQYNLYTSASYASVWGDGSGGSFIGFGFGSGIATPASLTVYGQLPDNTANRGAGAGTYTDTIQVTVLY